MLDYSQTPAEIANQLHEELGEGAYSFVSRRAEEARLAADARGVRFWTEVASELVRLDRRPRRGRGNRDSLARAMQRVEYCRKRAAEVERKAAAAPDLYRRDMLDLALQWRDLALQLDLQARSEGREARPRLSPQRAR